MKKKDFSLLEYFSKVVIEADEEAAQQTQVQQTEDQSQEQQQQNVKTNAAEAFRSLQGQTVSGVQYSPNGTNGGSIKINVKNSYIPFTISWVNQQVTVTTLSGETIVLSGG